MTDPNPTDSERRTLARLRRAASIEYWGMLPAVFSPFILRDMFSLASIKIPNAVVLWAGLSLVALWFVQLGAFFVVYLRCPRCKTSLFSLKAKAEWGAAGKDPRCAGCGMRVGLGLGLDEIGSTSKNEASL